MQFRGFPGAWKRFCCWTTIVATLLSASLVFAASPKSLPPRYRDWLTRDVAYIITREERQAFLALTTDDARDAFIQRFWEIRNPTPGSPTNSYEESIYRRIAYADQFFGHESGTPGWQTDMGRVYITLGPPEQRARYLGQANVRPMEIWFYQGNTPALPPYFSVVFYQREAGGDFRLYSPYMDGPEKLVSSGSTEGDRFGSLQVIDKNLGREVARTTLSLLPDEPVDMTGATSSLASDVLLSTIKSLADNPLNKQLLNERRELLESVTHRVVLTGEYLDVLTIPLVDRQGNTNLHYLMRLKRPDDFTLTQTNDGRYYYSVETSVRVLTPAGKDIFAQNRKLSRYLDQQQVEAIKHKVFGFEGVLPLAPGKYKIDFLFTNTQNRTALHVDKEVEIPQPGSQPLWLTPLVAFSEAKPEKSDEASTPFLAAGMKFTPVPKEPIELITGQPLQFFYQIWSKPAPLASTAVSKLHVEISYGRLGMHDTKTISDEVPRSQFDAHGTIINGKVIPTVDLPAGNYRVTVGVSDPETRDRAYSSFNVQLASQADAPAAWDVNDPDLAKEAQSGVLDYDRALGCIAQSKEKEALPWLKNAFDKNPQDEQVRARLIDALFSSHDFSQVAAIYRRVGVTPQTEVRTVMAMAQSLQALDDWKTSARLLESAVALHSSSGPLYLALATCYQRLGDTQKAAEMQQKARSLIEEKPQT